MHVGVHLMICLGTLLAGLAAAEECPCFRREEHVVEVWCFSYLTGCGEVTNGAMLAANRLRVQYRKVHLYSVDEMADRLYKLKTDRSVSGLLVPAPYESTVLDALYTAGEAIPIVSYGWMSDNLVGATVAHVGVETREVVNEAARVAFNYSAGTENPLVVCAYQSLYYANRCLSLRDVLSGKVTIHVHNVKSTERSQAAQRAFHEVLKEKGAVGVVALDDFTAHLCAGLSSDFFVIALDPDVDILSQVRLWNGPIAAFSSHFFAQGVLGMTVLVMEMSVKQHPAQHLIRTGPIIHHRGSVVDTRHLCAARHLEGVPVCPRTDPSRPECPCLNMTTQMFSMAIHGSFELSKFWGSLKEAATAFLDDFPFTVDMRSPTVRGPEGNYELVRSMFETTSPDGIAVTVANDFVANYLPTMVSKVPVVVFNSGIDAAKDSGALYIGQDEYIAGKRAGERFMNEVTGYVPKERCVCAMHTNESNLRDRCRGFGDGLRLAGFKGEIETTIVVATSVEDFEHSMKDAPRFDCALGLTYNAIPAFHQMLSARGHTRETARLACFDYSSTVRSHLLDPTHLLSFVVHQQQMFQGYLPFAVLFVQAWTGSRIPENVILSGPSFVDRDNLDTFKCPLSICPAPSAPQSSTTSLVLLSVIMSVTGACLMGGLVFLYLRLTREKRERARLYDSNVIAENAVVAIANMQLEQLDYLFEVKRKNRIQAAFCHIVNILQEYRSFIPPALTHPVEEEPPIPTLEKPETSDIESVSANSTESRRDLVPRLHLGLTSKAITIAQFVLGTLDETFEASGLHTGLDLHTKWASVLQSHEKMYNAVLDQFLGDTARVTWNVSVAAANSSAKAAGYSLDVLRANRPHTLTEVGISFSTCHIGNMGTATMRSFNIVGQAVGRSTTLMKLNRGLGTRILMCPRAAGKTSEFREYIHRPIDVVRGSNDELVVLYELQGRITERKEDVEWMYALQSLSEAEEPATASTYRLAWELLEHQRFPEAMALLREPQFERDVAVSRLLDRLGSAVRSEGKYVNKSPFIDF